MKKNELMTGDIIVNRSGYLGIVVNEQGRVIYQTIGSDKLDEFNADLSFADPDYVDGDIMEVYRDASFYDVDHGEVSGLIYRRDSNWKRPSAEALAEAARIAEDQREKYIEGLRGSVKRTENNIKVIAQQFYGNRTGTSIRVEDIDCFLHGIMSPELFDGETDRVSRKTISIPGTDNVVIVYDQSQEDEYVNEIFPEIYAKEGQKYRERCGKDMKIPVSCEIPEMGLRIHTRCFACRIDENRELSSLEDEDIAAVLKYFPKD